MKKFAVLFCAFIILPSFAEVAPVYLEESAIEYYVDDLGNVSDENGNVIGTMDEYGNLVQIEDLNQNQKVATKNSQSSNKSASAINKITTQRSATNHTASRVIPTTLSTTTTRATAARPVSNRSNSSRNTVKTVARGTTPAGNTVSRRQNANSGTQRSGRTNISTARAVTNDANTLTDVARDVKSDDYSAGRYVTSQTSPANTARVGVRTNTTMTRSPTIRAATSVTETASSVTSSIDELAQSTEFCKAQYTECMDQYCDILDENQGRCTCSVNITNYEKTETALKEATNELQDVAQKIQYIGLTGDEVESLFTQTEAEEAMQGQSDTTQLKNDLDKIKNLIIDVNSKSASSNVTMDLSSMLDFSFSNSGFDLSAFMGTGTVSSISNQRGKQLYDTATARCKTSVLDNCKSQGVDTAVITNSYDLEIDKQCLSYEKELTTANEGMKQTVRNAKSVLQKARLLVAQQKNVYDLRGCITALDECMQDEFVCGDNYESCLDPTGKYIVNGKIVAGSQPGVSGGNIGPTSTASDTSGGLYSVWNYSNSYNTWGNGSINNFITADIGIDNEDSSYTNMVDFLEEKIGYHDNDEGKDYGMCVSVLNKCKNVSYDTNKEYDDTNKAIEGFLQRTLTQIKAQQDEVLANYAEDCVSDVTSCLANNEYDEDSSLSMSAAKNACSAVIRSCASVTGNSENAVVASAVSSSSYSDQYSIAYEYTGIGDWASGYTYTAYYEVNFTYTLPDANNTSVFAITDTTCATDYSWYNAATGGTVVTEIPANPSSTGGSLKFYLRCNP